MPYLLNFPVDHRSNSFTLVGNSDQLTFEVQANLDLNLEHHIVGGGQFVIVYTAIWEQVQEYAKAFREDSGNIQVQDLPDDLGLLWDVWMSEDGSPDRSPLTWEDLPVAAVPDMSGIRGAWVVDPMVPPGHATPVTKVRCLVRRGLVIGYIHPIDGEITTAGNETYPCSQFVFWFSPAGPLACSTMDLQAPTSPFPHEAWALGNHGREVINLPVVAPVN